MPGVEKASPAIGGNRDDRHPQEPVPPGPRGSVASVVEDTSGFVRRQSFRERWHQAALQETAQRLGAVWSPVNRPSKAVVASVVTERSCSWRFRSLGSVQLVDIPIFNEMSSAGERHEVSGSEQVGVNPWLRADVVAGVERTTHSTPEL